MGKQVKALENQSKHLTRDEIRAREQAESETMPSRPLDPEKPHKSLCKDAGARRYWRSIVNRQADVDILDESDSEALAVLCSMLSRRDSLNALCVEHMAALRGKGLTMDDRLELVEKVDGLAGKLQSLEKTILSYSKELGLTPTGRASLARKKAAAAGGGEADDLFGD